MKRPSIVGDRAPIFWGACAAIGIGVLLHLPMLAMAHEMGNHLAGMPMDPQMWIGMLFIILGVPAAIYGALPKHRAPHGSHAGTITHHRTRNTGRSSVASAGSAVLISDRARRFEAAIWASFCRNGEGIRHFALRPSPDPVRGSGRNDRGSFAWAGLPTSTGGAVSILLDHLFVATRSAGDAAFESTSSCAS